MLIGLCTLSTYRAAGLAMDLSDTDNKLATSALYSGDTPLRFQYVIVDWSTDRSSPSSVCVRVGLVVALYASKAAVKFLPTRKCGRVVVDGMGITSLVGRLPSQFCAKENRWFLQRLTFRGASCVLVEQVQLIQITRR